MHEGLGGAPNDGIGVSSTKAKWAGAEPPVGRMLCTSVFLESPPAWAACSDGNEGKFVCPRCDARVGAYSWSGSPCSCGKWITPGFQFQLSRVDAKGAAEIRGNDGHGMS
jgi:hypothetical protein